MKKSEERLWPDQPMPAVCLVDVHPSSSEKNHPSALSDEAQQRKQEQDLIKRVQQNERLAVQEFYRMYAPTLLRRLLRLLKGDQMQAEDCLQQVFLKAFQSIGNFRGESSLRTWLHRITTHTVMDLFRSQESQTRFLEKLAFWKFFGNEADGNQAIPEKLFFQEESKELVHEGLHRLEGHKKMAVLLCDLEGYSIEEAAAELGAPLGTVASRLFRGRQELFTWLQTELRKKGFSPEEWLHE